MRIKFDGGPFWIIVFALVLAVAPWAQAGLWPWAKPRALPANSQGVIAAQVQVSSAANTAPQMTNRLEQARVIIARALAKAADCRGLPGWTNVAALENMVAEIERRRAAGDVADAYDLAASSRFTFAQERVKNEVIEAIPFLIIGPFGNPAWTDPNQPLKSPVLVTVESDRPFIGETDGTNWNNLARGFRINTNQTYPAFPGAPAKWTPAIKTEYLSFDVVATQYPPWLIVYAGTEIYSPEVRDASLAVKTETGSPPMTWVNGNLVTSPMAPAAKRPVTQVVTIGRYEGVIHCQLNKGWNTVLFRMLQRRGQRLYLTALKRHWQGNQNVYQVMDDLRYRLPGTPTNPEK